MARAAAELPHNVEAERAVLGAVLLDSGVLEDIQLTSADFHLDRHRIIFEACRELAADEFTTACAQGCPSRAITFGDAADKSWEVTKHVDDSRAYHVFEQLNTYTAVVYLKKVNH